jgi:hypothetical protein
MKMMLSATLVILMAVTFGYGQPPSLKANIDFPFTVEGKVLPAGQYDFARDETATAFRVTEGGKTSFFIPVITRIAGPRNEIQQNAYVVFDVVGGKTFLSEIWIPGDDGYLMSTTKEKHEHKTVTVKR